LLLPAEAAAHAHVAAKTRSALRQRRSTRLALICIPTGIMAAAHPRTATIASLLPDGVARGALGAPSGACAYLLSPGGCNRGPECLISHVKLTATQLRREQRRKAGTLKHGSSRKKKRHATREKEALSKSQRNQS
jgi:hypothetical protein